MKHIQTRHSKALVPLYFDPISGAGIFIIRKYKFHNGLRSRIAENCAVCIVRFMEAHYEVENAINYDAVDFIMTVERCDDVHSAFNALKTGSVSGEYYG